MYVDVLRSLFRCRCDGGGLLCKRGHERRYIHFHFNCFAGMHFLNHFNCQIRLQRVCERCVCVCSVQFSWLCTGTDIVYFCRTDSQRSAYYTKFSQCSQCVHAGDWPRSYGAAPALDAAAPTPSSSATLIITIFPNGLLIEMHLHVCTYTLIQLASRNGARALFEHFEHIPQLICEVEVRLCTIHAEWKCIGVC